MPSWSRTRIACSRDDTHYVRIYMGHLRRKIEADPARPAHLLTESGVGYRFAL
ncbi:hypothetical protein SBBP2_2350002 [Burkholderiales bacterium]|nr:hypothetical protein SBBP2_2350002 [Burkholderiales bacterium]